VTVVIMVVQEVLYSLPITWWLLFLWCSWSNFWPWSFHSCFFEV
jgi:hypothetical protein